MHELKTMTLYGGERERERERDEWRAKILENVLLSAVFNFQEPLTSSCPSNFLSNFFGAKGEGEKRRETRPEPTWDSEEAKWCWTKLQRRERRADETWCWPRARSDNNSCRVLFEQ